MKKQGDEYMKMIINNWIERVPLTIGQIRDKAWEEGLVRGMVKGRAEGHKEGRAEGRMEGWLEGHAEGMQEGRESLEKGLQQMVAKIARRCIEGGMSDEKIQTYTRLSPDQIKRLRKGRDDIGY